MMWKKTTTGSRVEKDDADDDNDESGR